MIVIDGVEMVDVREAATLADRTPETIRRWVWTRRAEAVKHGNRLFIARATIERLAAPGPAFRERGSTFSLADWAAPIAAERLIKPGVSAADLVFEDRAGR